MEEVDKIIIHSLQQIGCWLEEEEQDFSQSDTLVPAVVKCIETIDPQLSIGLPRNLPINVASRFRVAASLAQACQELGYTREIGCQTFLYPTEAEARRLCMFLVEKLPREDDKQNGEEPLSGGASVVAAAAEQIRRQLHQPWVPSYCLTRGIRYSDSLDKGFDIQGCCHYRPFRSQQLNIPDYDSNVSEHEKIYWARYLLPIHEQLNDKRLLIPSLITLNTYEKLAKFNLTQKTRWVPVPIPRTQNSESKIENQRENILPENAPPTRVPLPTPRTIPPSSIEQPQERLEKIRIEVESGRAEFRELESRMQHLTVKLNQITLATEAEEANLKTRGEFAAVRKKIVQLLPNAEENITKLTASIESAAQRLSRLASQWDTHRTPLINAYREARRASTNRATESQRHAESIRVLREKARELSEELSAKEALQAQLQAELARISKDSNRCAFTRRIVEIVNNIRKQKEEINKVLEDTRFLQKEIHSLTGRVERAFTVADELIFKDARQGDEWCRRAYKQLALLQQLCGELVRLVTETGAIMREIRDLEEQCEQESTKNVSANLARVSADLEQMRKENAAVSAQIEALNRKTTYKI